MAPGHKLRPTALRGSARHRSYQRLGTKAAPRAWRQLEQKDLGYLLESGGWQGLVPGIPLSEEFINCDGEFDKTSDRSTETKQNDAVTTALGNGKLYEKGNLSSLHSEGNETHTGSDVTQDPFSQHQDRHPWGLPRLSRSTDHWPPRPPPGGSALVRGAVQGAGGRGSGCPPAGP